MANNQPTAGNVFAALFAAIKAVNDNLVALADNLAATHEKVARIEAILTESNTNE